MNNNLSRLWIITELFPPDETSTSYILGEIANTMIIKYNVGVICGPEIYDKRKKLDSNSNFKLHPSIDVHRVKETGINKNTKIGIALSLILMSKKLLTLVKKYVKKDDIVLMVTNPAPLIPLMTNLKKSIGFRLNILVHDVFPENTIPAGFKLPMFGFIKSIYDRAYSQAEQIIVIGRDMADVLAQKVNKGVKDTKIRPQITIIENWGDVENIKPQPFPEGKIIIEYAGNIGRVQGLEKVMDELPDNVELHVYGTGSMEETLKNRKEKNVFFHGAYLRSQQNKVLASCDIALVTLQNGMYGLGVPSKTYNILASGRPILFFGPEDSEIDMLVRENNIGFCGWPKYWDRNILIDMGLRARKLVETKYSKHIILKKFLETI